MGWLNWHFPNWSVRVARPDSPTGSGNAGSIATGAYAAAVLSVDDAERVAVRLGLGDDAVISGPVAHGEVGQVW